MAEPSRVIHIRNVGHEISEVTKSLPPFSSILVRRNFLSRRILSCSPVQSLNFSVVSLRVQSDLLQVVQPFGTVAKLVMLRAKNQVGTLIRFASFSCY
jgi:hypothetical protein